METEASSEFCVDSVQSQKKHLLNCSVDTPASMDTSILPEPCSLCVVCAFSSPTVFLEAEAVESPEPGGAWDVVGIQYMLAKWISHPVSPSVKWDHGASLPSYRPVGTTTRAGSSS